MTQLQLASVTAAKQALNILGVLGSKEGVNIIVNRHAKTDLITLRDLHKIINTRIVVCIPADNRAAVSAAMRGIPVISAAPRSAIAKAFRNLAAIQIPRTVSSIYGICRQANESTRSLAAELLLRIKGKKV